MLKKAPSEGMKIFTSPVRQQELPPDTVLPYLKAGLAAFTAVLRTCCPCDRVQSKTDKGAEIDLVENYLEYLISRNNNKAVCSLDCLVPC